MSNYESLGDVLRGVMLRKRRRDRPCPWRRGVRVTDLDGTASQIPDRPQGHQGESRDGDDCRRGKG